MRANFNPEKQKEILNDDLIEAITDKDLSAVQDLVENEGASVFYENHKALRIACEVGDYSIVEYLISKKANVNVMDGAPLRIAIKFHNPQIIELLLKKGANPDLTNAYPAIAEAARDNNLSAMKILINHGCSVDAGNHCALRHVTSEEALNIIGGAYEISDLHVKLDSYKSKIDLDESILEKCIKKISVIKKMKENFG